MLFAQSTAGSRVNSQTSRRPQHQQADQSHRTQTSIMLNLNYSLKHLARRVAATW
jgi:hypothetical protein